MWCEGSLPWAYWPTMPAMSGGASAGRVEGTVKRRVELFDEGLAAAEESDEAGGVVLGAEGGLPGVGLGVVALLGGSGRGRWG